MNELYAQMAALIIGAATLLMLGIIAAMVFERDELPPVRQATTAYVYLVPVPTSQRLVMWQPLPQGGSS